jgi:hypothetical protein
MGEDMGGGMRKPKQRMIVENKNHWKKRRSINNKKKIDSDVSGKN